MSERMEFDGLAIAVDWLEAYRLRDLETILQMYSDDAVIECGCGGTKVISGAPGLRAYWSERLDKYPASELDDLQPLPDGGTAVAYVTKNSVIDAVMEFDERGLIKSFRCGPKPQAVTN